MTSTAKNSNQPLLSICIPTYNRVKKLSLALENIISIVRELNECNNIQLCVSDNHSTDQTKELVLELQKKNPDVEIKYHLQPNNLGFSRNLHSAAIMATGNYISFSGDDDLLCIEGLKILLEKIKNADIDLLLFSSHLGQGAYFKTEQKKNVFLIDSCEKLIVELGVFFCTFIGNVVIKNSNYKTFYDSNLLDSIYPHVGICLRVIKETKSVIFVDFPLYEIDRTENQWSQMQPIYTAVDMARLYTDYCFINETTNYRLVEQVYKLLSKSIFRAIYLIRQNRIDRYEENNIFQSLTITNIMDVYKSSKKFQILSIFFLLISRYTPLLFLKIFFKNLSH